MSFQEYFSDWPAETMPATFPAGFVDGSWRNDSCPCLWDEARGLHIYCDHPDAMQREMPGARYSLHCEGEALSVLAESEDWQGILDALAKLEGQPMETKGNDNATL